VKRVTVTAFLFLLIPAAGLFSPAPAQARIPVKAAVVINRAAGLLEQNRAADAISLLKEFKQKGADASPADADRAGYNHPLVNLVLGNCYLAQGSKEKAIECYRLAIEKQPELTAAWMNLGKCYYDMGLFQKAEDAFVKAYGTKDGKGNALYYAAVCSMMSGSYRQALGYFDRLRKERPGEFEPSWKETLARLYLILDMPAKALPYLEELSGTGNGSERQAWQQELVRCYARLGMKKKAISYVARLIEENPSEPVWWKLRAWLFILQEDYRHALADITVYGFQTGLSREEAELAGDLSLYVGIPSSAASYYGQAANSGISPAIAAKAAQACIRLHDFKCASDWVSRGLENGQDRELLRIKGYLLVSDGKYREAASVYQKIASLSPESGEPWMMLGYCRWQQGKTRAAAAAFRKAADCKGYNRKAMSVLRELQRFSRGHSSSSNSR